ncbi:pyruvate/2-oxoglutarate dehydrogenase complex dihydrolipoamide dehydrogenase (E3) component [Idiomarina fontislapidosi]|uniref:Soluble pyridine nucleotide transhydrogenase n=1 Tax=Idiomarina fontislapidosi TaxID=263723 RepID=A0A432XU17_9GAMM|nr:Si-specific NAD(P)(+) transhydrogenase [Idiomarina fontislapidosi]PYE31580.1 pyruvate/2-oxoglutarate dehydrogenase complex dihydrolipoamide dehydrogenase (E3) component [Idiomarina fontislapidosi]RUO52212.1 Si-specific NAD(P)(+) transhydrogenase [Idiomarina fontislapidosi]
MTKHKATEANFDVAVIGTGPGGEGAAMQLAKNGKKVAVIERHDSIGGGCTHWGTIPSKALRHSVSRLIEYNNSPLFTGVGWQSGMTFSQILHYASGVIRKQVKLRSSFYDRNHVTVIHGNASFIDQNRLKVTKSDGSFDFLNVDQIVIATGSRPYHPDDVDFDHPRIYDSDTVLSLNHDPKNILIYGAGVIGSEYASIFRGMGVKVDLINQRERLLSFLDAEISDALSYHLRNNGVVIRHNEEYESIRGYDDKVVLKTKSGKVMQADCLLFANGRSGNIESLNCEAVGLKPNYRGQLEVDENYRTQVDNIYAVGDIIGYPSLASAAYDQGRICATALLHGNCDKALISNIPTGIYTIPEISSVGKSEEELTEAKVPYEVGRAQFKHLARAQISGNDVGCLKILFHRESREILGLHCFGERASEIIHIGQAIMEQKNGGNTVDYFVNTTFNYPTMAEAYRVAALNGINRLGN